jgi:hypothetical protein
VGAELLHEEGWTDGRAGKRRDMTKLIVAFRQLCERAWKWNAVEEVVSNLITASVPVTFSVSLIQTPVWSFQPGLHSVNSSAYSYSTTNKMHLLSQIISSCKTIYTFRRSLRPSSGVQNYVYNIYGICQTAAATCCWQLVAAALWHIPLLYTQVLSSWWWKERPSETCKAFYKNK